MQLISQLLGSNMQLVSQLLGI